MELRPHQIEALRKMHNGCVLKGGVGTGKSIVAMAYYHARIGKGSFPVNGIGDWKSMQVHKDLYIITTAKKRDDLEWEKEASHFGLTTHQGSSNIGGVKVIVDSWNNIVQYKDVKDAFFIFDEQRLVGSGAWVKAFLKLAKQNAWILLSATPGDTWMDYIPVFVANGYYENRTDFIRKHVVWKPFAKFPIVDRYTGTAILEHRRAQVLVEMPYQRHTVRILNHEMVDYDVDKFNKVWKERWHVYEDRPLNDVGEMFRVGRRVVNSAPSRLGAIMALVERHPRLIVFYNFNYELDALRLLATNLNIPYAEWNGKKHQPIPETKSWIYLVQYTAGAEGWNCIATDAMAMFSLNYSYKVFEQVQGRIDRMNTPYTNLYYYVLRSQSAIDKHIWKAIVFKQNFNESKVTDPDIEAMRKSEVGKAA